MFSYGELSNQMSFIKLQQIMSHLPTSWVLVHGKITIVVLGNLILSIQSIERHRNVVSQHRKGVFGGHTSQQLNHYFLSPPNPIGDKLSSNKNSPPSALAILKTSLVANINFAIQHRSKGSPDVSKARL